MRSRRGRLTYLLAVGFGLTLATFLALTVEAALGHQYFITACGLMVVFVTFRPLAMVATLRLEVDAEGLSSSHLFQRVRFAWDEVTALRVVPSGYSLANLVVSTTTGHHVLRVWAAGNYRELATAILCHGEAANPAIEVMGEAFL